MEEKMKNKWTVVNNSAQNLHIQRTNLCRRVVIQLYSTKLLNKFDFILYFYLKYKLNLNINIIINVYPIYKMSDKYSISYSIRNN